MLGVKSSGPWMLCSWICERMAVIILDPWVWNEIGLVLTLSRLLSLCEFQFLTCKLGIIIMFPLLAEHETCCVRSTEPWTFYRASHECPSNPKVNLSTPLPPPPLLPHFNHSNLNHRNHHYSLNFHI